APAPGFSVNAERSLVESACVVAVDRGPEQTIQISEWRARVGLFPNVLELREYCGVWIRIEAVVDHRLPCDGAEVLRQHLGSVFIIMCATSIASWSATKAPSMIDKSTHGRLRGAGVRA